MADIPRRGLFERTIPTHPAQHSGPRSAGNTPSTRHPSIAVLPRNSQAHQPVTSTSSLSIQSFHSLSPFACKIRSAKNSCCIHASIVQECLHNLATPIVRKEIFAPATPWQYTRVHRRTCTETDRFFRARKQKQKVHRYVGRLIALTLTLTLPLTSPRHSLPNPIYLAVS